MKTILTIISIAIVLLCSGNANAVTIQSQGRVIKLTATHVKTLNQCGIILPAGVQTIRNNDLADRIILILNK